MAQLVEESPALSRIQRRPLGRVIAERLRLAIMRGDLKPGQTITESGLARELQVAQSSVREALVELENHGFIERPSTRRTRVTTLTRRDTREIYAIRLPLELLVLDFLASAQNVDWEACEQACKRMRVASAEGRLPDFEQADLDFHRALWAAAGNRHLEEILERLVGKIFAYEFSRMESRHMPPETSGNLVALHSRVLQSLREGNPAGAKAAMEQSMDRTWEDDLNLPEE